MKISTLIINNFRGIQHAKIEDAGDTIIIAGQNGSGKSCVFDAIRLLKSVYGGYHQNEWQNWFGEFSINPNSKGSELKNFLNNPSKPLFIDCYFKIKDEEKSFILHNAASLAEDAIWRTLLPEAFQWGGFRMAMFAAQFRERQQEVNEAVSQQLPVIFKELEQEFIHGQVQMQPGGQLTLSPSRLLSVIFTNFRPKDLGVIDFHGAQRHYGRETIQGINLNLDTASQQASQSALYNYSSKYANVKSEMASSFIKEILSEKAGNPESKADSLVETLKELFQTFFPGKEFLGPQATMDGQLEFPVKVANGNIHDLDELSSGEKEILYGYLRIRSSAPKNSIILLDEPELHLNPRLIRNLPEFYRKHLGEALNNQIWLVTHSDALLREAVGKPGFSVYHMFPCGADGGKGQLRALTASEDLDLAMADLVGDLAAYKPDGSAIIFEGGGDSDLDLSIVSRVFAEELADFNLLSGSNRARVEALHDVLNKAYSKGQIPIRFYAVTDMDSVPSRDVDSIRRFHWDVYHIENYLLEPAIICSVINAVEPSRKMEQDDVVDGLRNAARRVFPKLLRHKMRSYVNDQIVHMVNSSFDPAAEDIANVASQAAERSLKNVSSVVEEKLSAPQLKSVLEEWTSDIETSFSDGSWIKKIPGRDILKAFIDEKRIGISYEPFRNLIVSHMVDNGFKPEGMKNIIESIIEESNRR